MVNAFIILPNQLLKLLPSRDFDVIVLAEDPRFFSDFCFHKKKLMFHRASLKYYQSLLQRNQYTVSYLDHELLSKSNGLGGWLKTNKITEVTLFDPVDHELKDRMQNDFKGTDVTFEFISNPLFLCDESYLTDFFSDKEHYSMNSFYISQRKRLNVLLENGKPRGGQWSFDKENRQKLSKDIQVPEITPPKNNQFTQEASAYVNRIFPDNPGSTDNFFYPVTHRDAEKWFNDFLRYRLDSFGPYEDAISSNEPFLFHSILSPLLNSGLLSPRNVLNEVIDYSQENQIRLNSLEGFIRQLIGWREFMRAVYLMKGRKQYLSNFWDLKHKMPLSFYNGTTGIEPLDTVIKRVMDNAYAHHIERLMILANFMLLCEIHPKEVYHWFIELFIDAYEWVMVPNVFGMSQYADGGIITTKPYISSSNYIRKMSDFKTSSWCEIWDSLFWRFIYKYKDVIAQNPRVKMMAVQVDRMQKDKIDVYINKAESYLKKIERDNYGSRESKG